MSFGTVYITTAGASVAAKTAEGKQIEFVRFEAGSGTAPSNIRAMTALVNKVMEFDITKIAIKNNTQVTIQGLMQNTKAPSSFYFRELGLIVKDPDTHQDVLFAYTNAGDTADYISNSISQLVEKYIDLVVTVDNASNVTITLDATQTFVTEEELNSAIANAKFYTGKTYGIKRLITDNTLTPWTRIADNVGLVANATKNGSPVVNDFDDLYPWSHMQRCNVDPDTGKINAFYGDSNYKADGSNGEVKVRIPEFWYKREVLPDENGNLYEYIYIADYARAGYKKSKEFLIAAYLLSTEEKEVNNETVIVAHSRSGDVPRYNTTKGNFRQYAKNTGENFCLLDILHYCLVADLFLVEYANTNSQNALGQGIVAYSTGTALMAETNTNRIIITSAGTGLYVGKTVGIGTSAGNFSVAQNREITAIEDYDDGTISGKSIIFDGEAVDIEVGNIIFGSAQKNGENDILGNKSGCLINNGYHPVNYRGIENFFGNIWQHIDGLNIKDYQAYVCEDPEEYADDKFTAPYEPLGYVNANTTDSYIKELGFDEKHPEIALPTKVGASSSTGYCDNYWCAEGNRIAYFGGHLNSGWAKGGLFALNCSGSSSYSVWYYGARLLKYQ